MGKIFNAKEKTPVVAGVFVLKTRTDLSLRAGVADRSRLADADDAPVPPGAAAVAAVRAN